jgi:hypothetical protein
MSIDLQLLSQQQKLKIKQEGNQRLVWDDIRKKNYILTPEETVRQLFIHYLTDIMAYPKNKIAVEKKIKVLTRQKRFDIVVFDKKGNDAFMLIECKSPDITLSQETLNQVLAYNMTIKALYIVITNGLETYCYALNNAETQVLEMDIFPDFE